MVSKSSSYARHLVRGKRRRRFGVNSCESRPEDLGFTLRECITTSAQILVQPQYVCTPKEFSTFLPNGRTKSMATPVATCASTSHSQLHVNSLPKKSVGSVGCRQCGVSQFIMPHLRRNASLRKFGYEGFAAEVSINGCPHNSSSDTQNATSRILRLPRQRRFETVDQFFPHCLYHGMRGWVFIRFEGSLPPCTLHGGTPRAAPQAFRFPDPHTACFTLGRGSLANPRLSSEPDECIEALKRGE